MHASVALECAGQRLLLLGQRALYWPALQRLLIADLHLGKAAMFRRAGIALPRGGTSHDLDRLTELIDHHGARELWILGDLLHGAPLDAGALIRWQRWRARHAQVSVCAIAGNHDRGLSAATLALDLRPDGYCERGLVLRHAPAPVPGGAHLICGHLHPVVRVPGLARRWPAFWLRRSMLVLPAFSQFTGGVAITPQPGEQLVACVEGEAIALPVR